jgi:shikimate kinase
MHLYITGFMGVGKTTFGKQVANMLQLPFVDTDILVEQTTKKSITTIFEQEGEVRFRIFEADVLRSIPNQKPAVIATGGGLPCFHHNMDFMNEHGFTVYLRASEAFIYNRLMQAKIPRPLLNGLNQEQTKAFIHHTLSQRSAFYLQSAMVIDVPEKEPRTLAKSVVEAYQRGVAF